MKILITGIAGFLGSHLAEKLSAMTEAEIIGNDSLIGGYADNVPSHIHWEVVDCCDFNEMNRLMEGVDVVVHAAATAHEGLSVFSPSFITKNIFEASVTTMSAAVANNVKKFIFCSSMARYGNQESPFTEDMTPQPVDPYAVAKVAAEDVLKILSKVHGMKWNIAVPHNIVGPKQRYDDPFRNVMSIMANRNLMGKPSIIYGDGEQTRCFSYVDDCVRCLMEMIFRDDINEEVINIGPDEGSITINDLADLVADKTGVNAEPIYMDDRPQEVKHANCSADKARKLLHFKTNTTVEEMVESVVQYIKDKGPKPFNYNLPVEIKNEKTPKTWSEGLM